MYNNYILVNGLDLGITEVEESINHIFSITNNNSFSIPFEITLSNVINFSCNPQKGIIYSNGSLEFILTYCSIIPYSCKEAPENIQIKTYNNIFKTYSIPLYAITKQSKLYIQKENRFIHFGTILVNEKRKMKFEMENKYDKDIICNTEIKGNYFSLDNDKPITVKAHQKYKININYNPLIEEYSHGY